jgi:hypothetical protein
MIHKIGEEQVMAYRPSHASVSRPAKRSIVPSSSPHRRSRIVNPSADPQMGLISPRFTVQDFCRSSASSDAASPLTTYHDSTDEFRADVGVVHPARGSCQPEHAAGIARLINTFNPDVTLKRSNFRDSSASKLYSPTDDSPPSRRDRGSPQFASGHSSSTRLTAKRLKQLTRSCSSCGERDTPKWRCGPSGLDTLCNFCGLMYAKRQEKGSDREHRSWKKNIKSTRLHA